MTRKEIQSFLGGEYVVKDILENKDWLYAFFVTRKYDESDGDDRYITVGNGPFYLNKSTGEYGVLGAVEFYEHHANKPLFHDQLEDNNQEKSWQEVVADIKSRNHINFDDFERFMTENGIPLHSPGISSKDDIHWLVECESKAHALLFKNFFDEVDLENEWQGETSIRLKND